MALTTNLDAYYKLDESSGNAADSVGSKTFTNVGTTPFAAGKINNGADFGTSNTTKYFTGVAGGAFQPTGDFTLAGWVKPATLNSAHHWIFTSYDEGAGAQGIYLYIHPSNKFQVGIAGTGGNTGIADTTVLSTGTWYFVVARSTSGGALTICVNNNTPSTTTPGFTQTYSSPNVRLGNRKTAAEELFFDGMVDEFGIWSRVLSDAEVTQLYNGGAGLQYPFAASNNGAGFFMMMA